MMKYLTLLLFVVILAAGCGDDDDLVVPNVCDELREEIQSIDIFENVDSYRFEAAGRSSAGSSRPSFDGCLVEFRDAFYNLNQLISLEVSGSVLILRFA